MRSTQQSNPPKTPPWLNRTMGALVRSPLSRLVDRTIALLTVFGRRSGHPYTFPVQYVQDHNGEVLWILAMNPEDKTWWRNLADGADVEVHLRRQVRRGRGTAYTSNQDPEIVEEGLRRYVQRFPNMAKRMGIQHGGGDQQAIAEAAARSVIVRIDLKR